MNARDPRTPPPPDQDSGYDLPTLPPRESAAGPPAKQASLEHVALAFDGKPGAQGPAAIVGEGSGATHDSATLAPKGVAAPPIPAGLVEQHAARAKAAFVSARTPYDAAKPGTAPSHAPTSGGATAGPAVQEGFALMGAPAERYQSMGELGRGGMGAVYRVLDRDLEREVALKVLLEDVGHDPGCVARFIAEARAMAGLQHPGIIPVYDFGIDALGHAYFTMKLVEGRTLAKVVSDARKGEDPESAREFRLFRLLEVVAEIARAVAFAHDKGVVHRDLKPQNVMIGRFGEVQVMDWGLAKARRRPAGSGITDGGADSGDRLQAQWNLANLPPLPGPPGPPPPTGTLPVAVGAAVLAVAEARTGMPSPSGGAPVAAAAAAAAAAANLPPLAPPVPSPPQGKASGRFSSAQQAETIHGTIIGTPAYMAPEQAAGDPSKLGPWTDIFALGAILFHAVTGRPPFRSEGGVDVLTQVAGLRYPRPRSLDPTIPREVEAIIVKSMARKREERYASAELMAADLQAFLEGEPVAAYAEGPLSRAWKFCKRHRYAILGTAATVTAALTFGEGMARVETSRVEKKAAARKAELLSQAHQDLENGEAAFDQTFRRLGELQPPLWERRAATLRTGEMWAYFSRPPRNDVEAHDRLVIAGEEEPTPGTAIARWKAREAQRAEQRALAEERASWAESKLRAARERYLEAADKEDTTSKAHADRVEVRRLLHMARLEIVRGSPEAAVAYVNAAAAGLVPSDRGLLGEARGLAHLHLAVPGGPAVASVYPVDGDTLATAAEPLADVNEQRLPVDLEGIPPGEYEVVITASDLPPEEARERAMRFPILVAAGEYFDATLPLGPKDVPRGFVYVPEGPIFLGSRINDMIERPVRFVSVPAFFLAKCECTVDELERALSCVTPRARTLAEAQRRGRIYTEGGYKSFEGLNFRTPTGSADVTGTACVAAAPDMPATQVTFEDARVNAARLGGRLPTEIEWEKAARGFDGRHFPWGDQPGEEGKVRGNYWGERDGAAFLAPVGRYPAGMSPYGALDMGGNVYEWCGGTVLGYADLKPVEAPDGQTYHAYRGCSWVDEEGESRITYRYYGVGEAEYAEYRDASLGFRLARDVPLAARGKK